MEVLKQMPEGDYCYESHMFYESLECPNYIDGTQPRCSKYNWNLKFTISGHTLKCKPCEESRKLIHNIG